jgi:hypothetical protein
VTIYATSRNSSPLYCGVNIQALPTIEPNVPLREA